MAEELLAGELGHDAYRYRSQRVAAAVPPVRNARSRSARPSAGSAQRRGVPHHDVPLSRGILLALYTDGLIEIPGSDHEPALADLAAVLSKATGPLDDVADTRLAHAQPSGDRADDTALLLVKIN